MPLGEVARRLILIFAAFALVLVIVAGVSGWF
jgi:hypothetical protein